MSQFELASGVENDLAKCLSGRTKAVFAPIVFQEFFGSRMKLCCDHLALHALFFDRGCGHGAMAKESNINTLDVENGVANALGFLITSQGGKGCPETQKLPRMFIK